MSDWVQVTDVSQHNGTIDFQKMKAAGVDGVIIRATHGLITDKQFAANAAAAQNVFGPNVGAYTFCNPKRGTPWACAAALTAAVRAAFATDPFLMLDVESYAAESPMPGTSWSAADYALWLNEFINQLHGWRLVGYTNDAYWKTGVNDPELAGRLEWIGARYPVYSLGGYVKHPLPGPDGWDEWAFSLAAGPILPKGAGLWQGWQFSAGYNQQGPRYGCSSSDLDLNIVRPDAWAKWTATASIPPPVPEPAPVPRPPTPEDDMSLVLFKAENPPAVLMGWSMPPDYPAVEVEHLPDDATINAFRAAGAIDRPGNPLQATVFKNCTIIGAPPPGWVKGTHYRQAIGG